MKIVSLAEVKAKLSAYLDWAESSGPVVITRNGRAVAVLVAPTDEADLERLVLSRSPRFRSLLAKSRTSIAAGKGISQDKFWGSVAEPSPAYSKGSSEHRKPTRKRTSRSKSPRR